MNSKSFMIFEQIIKYLIKYFKVVVIFAAALIAASGIYRVESNEAAIVLRFGRLVGTSPEKQIKNPGLHFALPFFIDEVIKIPVQKMHEKEITTHYIVSENRIHTDVARNGYLLTGDNNIVLIRATVFYQIENPVHYAIYSNDTDIVIDCVVSGELTRLVTQMDIDSVLTKGRAELASSVLMNAQRNLDELKVGITVAAVELVGIVPPMETAEAFDEVRSAAVFRETLIQRAQEFASSVILKAQAEARSYTQSAISDQHVRLTTAHIEMAEFNGIYDLYAINPQMIISGIFKERAAAIIAKSGGSIIIPEGDKSPVILLQ